MAHHKILTRKKNFEGVHFPYGEEVRDNSEDWEDLEGLGNQFLGDKQKLDEAYAKIANSELSAQHKRALLEELKATALQVQAEYDQKVTQAQERLREQNEADIAALQKQEDALDSQASDLRGVTMEVSEADTTRAAEVAEAQKEFTEQKKQEYIDKLNRHIADAERLRDELLKNRMNNS